MGPKVFDRPKRGRRPVAAWGRSSIRRLRAIFLVIAALLTGCVLLLSYVMRQRLIAATHEREEMIALRVFDELEREVNAFLETENERGPYGNLAGTNPERWAPFVVGYFKQGVEDEVVSADGSTTENRRRMLWALKKLNETRGDAIATRMEEPKQHEQQISEPKQESRRSSEPNLRETVPGSKIIESLNRAPERRKQATPVPKSAPSSKDPFSDYAEAF